MYGIYVYILLQTCDVTTLNAAVVQIWISNNQYNITFCFHGKMIYEYSELSAYYRTMLFIIVLYFLQAIRKR